MRVTHFLGAVSLALLLFATACRQEPPAPAAPPQTNAAAAKLELRTFLVNGLVKKIEAENQNIVIQHEKIPGFMDAMTMPFEVKNTNELAGLQAGDSVVFRLNVTEDDSWIDKLKKASAPLPAQPEPPKREPVRLVRDVEVLEIGDALPNYRFTNEFAQPVELSQFKGKALALTFIFTRCPMPEFCPLMTKRFSDAYEALASRADAPANWHLLSLSFDPHFDTPAVLKSYAERFGYTSNKWSFVTGAMIDIDAITEQFDLPIVVRDGQWDHKLRTAVIDANGRLQKVLLANQWKTGELVEEIIKAAKVPPTPDTPEKSTSK